MTSFALEFHGRLSEVEPDLDVDGRGDVGQGVRSMDSSELAGEAIDAERSGSSCKFKSACSRASRASLSSSLVRVTSRAAGGPGGPGVRAQGGKLVANVAVDELVDADEL